ncbi:chaperonin 10-like protein [Neohortaea acidophila]|uniref:Chaperonin 10-like protein n=1 Tax=Neohortaea acidophila TaxID=245834 RepID=A0A6A6PL40_9PEZI|nr:chaperonin 10-like protein [Neohortaea acidophila]KAF2480732.1 chaperonin 10-like protein [Neohortaea acidophila]
MAAGVESFKNIETVALVVDEAKADFKLQPIVLDEVRGDEVLIEMKYSGICHTDIVLQQGLLPLCDFPAVFGHEGAGIIRAIGKDVKNKELKVGDAALLSFNHCGTCTACVGDHPAYCHTHALVNHNAVRLSDRSTPARRPNGEAVRSQYFGQSSFSKMSVVNEKCVVKCPNPDRMDIYAPFGCGVQTGAGTVLNVLKPTKDESLVIFGIGTVGISALMAAKHIGAGQIIAVDIVDAKLQLAKELGATAVVNSKEQPDTVAAIKALTNGKGAKYTIDCTGLLPVIQTMVDCLQPEGTAAVVGVPPPDAKISIDPLMFLLDNKKLIGVIEGDSNPSDFIPKLIQLHQDGHFPIEKICKTYPVDKLADAIHDLHTGAVTKPVIDWG